MIIEIVDRVGNVLSHYKIERRFIQVGRGYDNDLILHDPYVNIHHLTVAYDEVDDVFILKDLNSINGTRVLRVVPKSFGLFPRKSAAPTSNSKVGTPVQLSPALERTSTEQAAPLLERDTEQPLNESRKIEFESGERLGSGETICVGKTLLRIRSKEHEMAEALPISLWDQSLGRLGRWWITVALAFLLVSTEALLTLTKRLNFELWSWENVSMLYVLLIPPIYAGIWSVVANIRHREIRFLVHMNIAFVSLCGLSVLELVLPFIYYFTPLLKLGNISETLLFSAILFLSMWASLYVTTKLKWLSRAAVAALIPVIVFSTAIVSTITANKHFQYPFYDDSLLPPAWQMKSIFRGINAEEFSTRAMDLYETEFETELETELESEGKTEFESVDDT